MNGGGYKDIPHKPPAGQANGYASSC